MTFVLLCNVYTHSQNNDYKIEETIKIEEISLSITRSVLKYNPKRLVTVRLNRENDSITYLSFKYGSKYANEDVVDEVLQDWKPINSIEIDSEIFDEIVKDLNKLDIKELNKDFRKNRNVLDGSVYDLSFTDYNYNINVTIYAPNVNTEEGGFRNFLNVCEKIWDLKKLKNN